MFNQPNAPDEAQSAWDGVPEPQAKVPFMVDDPKDGGFTVLAELEVAGLDVSEMIYMVGGVWRVTVEDTDEDEETTSALLNVEIDRRYDANEVRTAVTKLLENLYRLDSAEE